MTLILTGVLHPHNPFSHTKQAVCVYSYSLAGEKSNCSINGVSTFFLAQLSHTKQNKIERFTFYIDRLLG